MAASRERECFVILEGIDMLQLRYVCLYWDFEEAHTFCRTSLTQLAHKMHIQAHVVRYARHNGHHVQLVRDRDNEILAQYVIQKTNIL